MPDISKLPELCELLDITFETLVDGSSRETKTVEKVLEGEPVTVEEAAEVASLLPPETMEESARAAQTGEGIDFETLMDLAPFLDEPFLDELVQGVTITDLHQLGSLAPFLSEKTLSDLARKAQGDGDLSALYMLAPFVDQKTLDGLALSLREKGPLEWKRRGAVKPNLTKQKSPVSGDF